MFESLTAIQLARLQFGITAMYHFIFVPLTLGLSFLLAIMESVYVMTRKPIWKQMTQFWGLLLGKGKQPKAVGRRCKIYDSHSSFLAVNGLLTLGGLRHREFVSHVR